MPGLLAARVLEVQQVVGRPSDGNTRPCVGCHGGRVLKTLSRFSSAQLVGTCMYLSKKPPHKHVHAGGRASLWSPSTDRMNLSPA